MDSARATLEWHVSPYVLETASALTRVESLNKKADRRVHVCDYKNMSNDSICSEPDNKLPCDRTTKWWSFCIIRWTFEIERLQATDEMDCVTRISHEILLRFTQNTPALECTHDRERILRHNLTLEWRRQGKYRWMFAAWPSWRRLKHVQKFHWHPWTHYVRCLDIRDISIWASSCYISWNVSVSESRLEMCHLKRKIFRGPHCGQDDDRSRDTDLTIHVNVTTKDNYRPCQRNRTMKDHLILIWVRFDTLRNVVSRFISYWIVLCKCRYMTRTNAHTYHVNHKNNQRH